ncbi:MAG: hypothetical protein ACYSTY_06325, partial [Planctomycetota bacterium]
MYASEWVYWARGILVLAIYVGAIYLAWWALFKDRARGRRRCPRCWHDLAHTPGMTCSECGFSAHHEGQFARTRRRWAHAGAAIGTCVAVAGAGYWSMPDRGWASYLPTRSLIVILPVTKDLRGSVYRELNRRAAKGRLTDGQWSALVRRCAAGDWWTRPTSEQWITKYGSFLETRRRRVARNSDLEFDEPSREALLRIPPKLELTTRDVWPRGAAPWIRFQMHDWWPLGPDCRITMTPRLEGATPISVYQSGHHWAWSGYYFSVPQLAGRSGEIEFEIEVEREEAGGPTQEEPWRLMSRQTLALAMRLADPQEFAFEPVDDPALQEAIRSTFGYGACRWSSGPTPARFSLIPYSPDTSDFEDTAFGLRVEVLRGDELAWGLDIWWRAAVLKDPGAGRAAHTLNPELLALLPSWRELRRLRADGQREEPAWSMRITGDPEIALRAGGASRYWSGQLTIPLYFHDHEG